MDFEYNPLIMHTWFFFTPLGNSSETVAPIVWIPAPLTPRGSSPPTRGTRVSPRRIPGRNKVEKETMFGHDQTYMMKSAEIRSGGDVGIAWLDFPVLFAPGILHERAARPRYELEPIAAHAEGERNR